MSKAPTQTTRTPFPIPMQSVSAPRASGVSCSGRPVAFLRSPPSLLRMRTEWIVRRRERPQAKAAGGLVVRGPSGDEQVAVVHRPKYDDWSLPKGKLRRWEGWKRAAIREVEEETGLRCEALEELPPARYRDRKGRRKLVRFWLMRPVEGSFVPSGEVDELRWVPPAEAMELLDYEHDRELVASLARRGRPEVERSGERG
jgi:8-oxo-dGTP diphosphatase